jgi:two-component system CheB/CheR fusion protein
MSIGGAPAAESRSAGSDAGSDPIAGRERAWDNGEGIADVATFVFDNQLQLQLFTRAAGERFGIGPSDEGKDLADLLNHFPGYNDLLDDARHVLETLTPRKREVNNDKEPRYFALLCPHYSADNEVNGLAITLGDSASRSLEETKEMLSHSQEGYRLLVESAREYSMFVMDEKSRIVVWNTGAEHILGFEEEEVLGLPGAIIFTPEDRAAGVPEQELRKARQDGQAMNERWHIRKDGSRFWGSGVVTALWEGEKARGYAKVMRDNTAREQAEKELETRVLARTTQVRQLATALVATEQTVRQRIAQTLHDDLQQLLYAADMQLQLLSNQVGERSELDDLREIMAESLRLTRQLSVELSPPVLKGEGLREMFAWLAQYMNDVYDLQVSVEGGDPSQYDQKASEEQRILLFQIVRELLFNVVKHAGVRAAQVTVQEEQAGTTIMVSDEGRGFQVEEAWMERSRSFGLWSVHERLQLFDGRANIESQPGSGTRIFLFMPHS